MITLYIGVNAFVFMSMRDVAFGENLAYTTILIATSVLILSGIAYLQRSRRKRSNPENKVSL
jgi:hypothetical protein